MAFKLPKERDEVAEINMIPLIDVMLVLLVIFMIAAPLLSQKIAVDLPSASATAVNNKDHVVDITLDATGHVFVNNTPQSVEALPQVLRERKKEGMDEVHLNADKNVRYDILAQIMSIAQQEGIQKIGFLTQNK